MIRGVKVLTGLDTKPMIDSIDQKAHQRFPLWHVFLLVTIVAGLCIVIPSQTGDASFVAERQRCRKTLATYWRTIMTGSDAVDPFGFLPRLNESHLTDQEPEHVFNPWIKEFSDLDSEEVTVVVVPTRLLHNRANDEGAALVLCSDGAVRSWNGSDHDYRCRLQDLLNDPTNSNIQAFAR